MSAGRLVAKDIVERDGQYCVQSQDGSRSFGCYPTRGQAQRRLAQVEHFAGKFDKAVPDNSGGVMIALMLPPEIATGMTVHDGLPAEELHLTLAHLGTVEECALEKEDLERLVAGVAADLPPELGEFRITGQGRFAPDTGGIAEEPEYPFVLTVDPSPELLDLHARVEAAVRAAGGELPSTHGWTPHVTLSYVKLEDDDPARVAAPMTFELPRELTLAYGGERCAFEFGAPVAESPDSDILLARYAVARKADEKRYTLGPVYLPDTLDAHDEFVASDTLQEAFWDYFQHGDRAIHLQHTNETAGRLVELVTWPYEVTVPITVPGEDPREQKFPPGTVFAGVVWDQPAWKLIKAGKLRGLSMGGRAKKLAADFD